MERSDAFSRFHPAVPLLWFCLSLGMALLRHPMTQVLSLFGAVCANRVLCREKEKAFLWKAGLPLCAFAALSNALFNHQGVTILGYFPSGNPLTMESLLFGASAACMLLCVLLLFRCFSQVMTSDKTAYLFGRLLPSLSLLLHMTLRFVPAFRRDFLLLKQANESLFGRPKTKRAALRQAFSVFGAALRRALDHAVTVSDAMKSRGHGTARRTSYSLFAFRNRDRVLLCLFGCGFAALLCAAFGGVFRFQYFPFVSAAAPTPLQAGLAFLLFFIELTPVALWRKEVRAWS